MSLGYSAGTVAGRDPFSLKTASLPVKVLCVLDSLETGGAELSLSEIYGRLRATECVICHLYPGDRLRRTFEEKGLRVLALDLPGKYGFALGIRKLSEVVQKEKPAVLHSTLFRSGIVSRWVARQTGLPLVDSLVNDSYGWQRRRELSLVRRLKLSAVRSLDRATAPWASRFVANSRVLKEAGTRDLGIPPTKIEVIPRGRDPERFATRDPSAQARLRASLSLGDARPILLNVARLRHRKGQKDLIDAMPRILERAPGARLLLVGEGPDRPRLARWIAEKGVGQAVHLLGDRDDVPELLGLSDVFVFPSHYEGLPGALIEAMLAGLPIVASDTPHHRECLVPGRTGHLTPVGNPAALAEAVIALLEDPDQAARLGREARVEAISRFSIEGVAARYEELLHRVAGTRRSPAGHGSRE